MKSMTGHGRGEAAVKGVRAVVECFSVNRKQGEVAVSVPRELSWLEPHVREDVLKRVARGKVQVSVVVENTPGASAPLIDETRAADFLRQARALQKKLGLGGEIRLETVLAAPGVLKSGGVDDRDILPAVKKALAAALDDLLVMRTREGRHLKKELARSAGQLAALVKKVRALAPGVPKRQRENLQRRLAAANLPVDLLDPRLVTEIAVFAERCDITEELTRLESHLAQLRENLESDGPVGRTLEFLTQEMAREWNTTGAKANDAEISRLVVEAKSQLDRLREQLANIE
jgi:TIGR00255 family protein